MFLLLGKHEHIANFLSAALLHHSPDGSTCARTIHCDVGMHNSVVGTVRSEITAGIGEWQLWSAKATV